MPTTDSHERPSIPALTSLRGVAATMVVIHHMTLLMLPLGSTAAGPALQKLGMLGMNVFFVLSGFVMYYNYGHRFSESWQRSTTDFLKARVARLYPLMVAFVILNFLLNTSRSLLTGNTIAASTYLATLPLNLLGIESWLYAVFHGVNVTISQGYASNLWSISSELFIYALFIPLAIFRRYRKPSLRWGTVMLGAGIAGRIAFIWYCSIGPIAPWLELKFGVSETLPAISWLIYFSPYGRCFEFFAGMGLAEIWLARRLSRDFALGRLIERALGTSALLYIAMSFLSRTFISEPMLFEGNSIYIGYVCSVPLAIYFLCRENNFATSLLSWSPLLYVGDISYSLYMIHGNIFPLLQVRSGLDPSKHIPMIVTRVAIFLPLTFGMAILLHRLLEVPARKTFLNLLHGRRTKGENTKHQEIRAL